MAKAFLSVLFFLSITPIRGGEKKPKNTTTKNNQAKKSPAVMRNGGCQNDI